MVSREKTELTRRHWLVLIIVWLAISFLYLYFFAFRAHLEIDLKLLTSGDSQFEVFWEKGGTRYGVHKSIILPVRTEKIHYSMYIGHLGSMTKLRIDPVRYKGQVEIKRIAITQPGFEPIILDAGSELDGLGALNQINKLESDMESLVVTTSGKDSQLQLLVEPKRLPGIPIAHVLNLLLAGALIYFIGAYYLAGFRRSALSIIPIFLLVSFSLTLVMASITKIGVHPDEWVHFGAVKYYSSHLLPPSIEDPGIADTFSLYGKSRLSSYESYYPVAGYFSRILEPFALSELLKLRLFNVFLFVILLLFCVTNKAFRYFCLPLLISSQVWYLYGYINSDAYALFLVVFMGYQAAFRKSILNGFLQQPEPGKFALKLLFLGGFFGSLILLKPNYYVFLLFLAMYLGWRLYIGDFLNKKILFTRIAMILVIATALPAIRAGLDVYANGFNTLDKYEQMIEEKASYLYKPSTPKSNKYANLHLKERGITLDQVLQNKHWGGITFITSFGSYGFTQFNPGDTYILIMKCVSLLLMLTVVTSVLVRAPPEYQLLLLIVIVACVFLLGLSLWASWVVNFQPQGRYLAPMLAIFGVLLYHIHDYLYKTVFYSLVTVMFSMSVYSFIFIGLRLIEKTGVS